MDEEKEIVVDKEFLLKLSKQVEDNFKILNKRIDNIDLRPKGATYQIFSYQADPKQVQAFINEIKPILSKYGVDRAIITKL